MENFAINKEKTMLVCTKCGSEATVFDNCETSDRLYVCGTRMDGDEEVILVNDHKNVWAETVSNTAECQNPDCGNVEYVLVEWE